MGTVTRGAPDNRDDRPLGTVEIAERHKLEAIFRESPAAMALWRGPQLVFELVNPEYQRIFGTRVLLGKPLLDALPEIADQGFAELLLHVFETGEPFVGRDFLARIASSEGGPLVDHYYDFSYVRVVDTDGRPYGVYDHSIDVTERVVARRELEAGKLRLEASVQALHEERELRDRLIAALTHDLRTPLNVARVSAEVLAEAARDPEDVRKAARRIMANIDRAETMIHDLLDLSRIRGGERIPLEIVECDLAALTRNTVANLAAAHRDRFFVLAPPSLAGHWDCRAIQRVIENLATNAVKYGLPGSRITVRVGESAGTVTLTVHNEGTPIPVEDQRAIFELYKRATGGPQVGWGIGLSLVQGLVRAHGGQCGVTSTATEGTTFTVTLPRDSRPQR